MPGWKFAFGALILIAALAAGYWASLLLSLQGLDAALRNRDVIKLEKYVDWARIRDQLRSEIKSITTARLIREAASKDGSNISPFGALIAGAIAPAMIDQLVNDLVTARSFTRLLKERELGENKQPFSLTRIGFTDVDEYTVAVHAAKPKVDQEVKLIVRRDGLTWRVSTIDFGPGDFPWEQFVPGAGLQVTVNPARTPDSLVVNGTITNTTPTTREIPRLRVVLRDGNNAEVASQIIDTPRDSLASGATTSFSTVFKHPSFAATGVAVTFMNRD